MAVGRLDAQRSAVSVEALSPIGAAALDERCFGDALDAFTSATKLEPRDASLFFAAGLSAFMLGRKAEAEDWFQRSLAIDLAFVASSRWLGELQYRDGRIVEAIATY
jgi:tetratricopeptide (TPR) repeat protein